MRDKPNTKFRPCAASCGQTVWCEEPVICPACLASIEEHNRLFRERNAKRKRGRGKLPADVGAAYTRGLAASKLMRLAVR